MKKKIVSAISFIVISIVGCTYDKGETAKPKTALTGCDAVTYTKDVAPLVSAKCVSCHNSGFPGYDLSTYAGLKQKADNGTLRNRVLVIKDMPVYCPLTADDAQKIDCWLSKGAPDN